MESDGFHRIIGCWDGFLTAGLCFAVSFWEKIPVFYLAAKYFSQELSSWRSHRDRDYLLSSFQLIESSD